MATAGTIRQRYGPRVAAWRGRRGLPAGSDARVALPDLSRGEELGLDPVLVQASLLEVGELG